MNVHETRFDAPLDLNVPENRGVFFKEITQLIAGLRTKIRIEDDKTAREAAYAYLIPFILYKVLVDSRFKRFEDEYKLLKRQIDAAIQNGNSCRLVVLQIKNILEYVSREIYEPFAAEQWGLPEIPLTDQEPSVQDLEPWFDIVAFLDKFDFSDLKNEIFGFVHENYLKELHGEKKQGQFFTDPAVVDFMLNEVGYTSAELAKDKSRISILDPACGAGTFLYSAVDRIIGALTPSETAVVGELIADNVCGLDVAGFPLFLAEMSALVRLLPLIANGNAVKKPRLHKTRDSIAEFLDPEKERPLFDFVIGNPPYIGYNECSKQRLESFKRIQDKKDAFITLGNVYGVNLHSVPGASKPYAPKPNLYAFFVALGLALLKENGKLCFIVPQTLLSAEDLDVLRYHLARNTSIEKIITFGGGLFIDRGMTTKKRIDTSSLIMIVAKKKPEPDHHAEVVRFAESVERKNLSLQEYLNEGNKTSSFVRQTELAQTTENWNYIKYDAAVLRFLKLYNGSNFSVEEYRRRSLGDYNEVRFDKGLVFDKAKINVGAVDWLLPKRTGDRLRLETGDNFIATKNIRIPQGSQGLKIFGNKYKIVWRYMNPDRFRFSDEKIMINFNWVIISSENKREVLFLLAILNSTLTRFVLRLYLESANEQALLVGVKSIKKHIRIPRTTSRNRALKDKIIARIEAMLALEGVASDFSRDEWNSLKKKIDDLVFAMYFEISVQDVAKHEFYDCVNSSDSPGPLLFEKSCDCVSELF